MMKIEALALTLFGSLTFACSSSEPGDSDGSTSAASDTTPTTTQTSNSPTEASTSSGMTGGLTGTGPDTATTDPGETSGTAPGTTDTGTSVGTTGDGTTGDPFQCGLQLTATIRDFKMSHPDIETYCCDLVKGLVKPELGADDKPVFNQIGDPQMLTSAAAFNQWYNDTPNVNMATQITLDLQEVQPGVYSYQNNSFFPIDDQLFGNEGNDHNFHFTTEIHSSFQYNGGETFTFTGDDDVWVFIDKQLVIDIGGVHENIAASVKLDGLGLTAGQIYPLDVFHAERNRTESNFRIDTTICATPQ